MTIIWEKLSIAELYIDKQPCILKSHRIEANLSKGTHRVDVVISDISISKLRKRILLNWISSLGGEVSYTIENALMDAYDEKISFDLSIDDCDQVIDLDDFILTSQEGNFEKTKEINRKRLNLVKRLYWLPFILLGGVLSATFLILGIITIRHYSNVVMGIFCIIISALSLLLIIGLIAKTKKQIKKLLHK